MTILMWYVEAKQTDTVHRFITQRLCREGGNMNFGFIQTSIWKLFKM